MMNSRWANKDLLFWATVLLVGVALILPFFSVEEYQILTNTTSHLGAQQAPYAWVMNGTFVLLGLGSGFAGWRAFKGYGFQRAVLIVFAVALVGVALFQHKPIVEGLAYDLQEDRMHSFFASTVGFAFTLFSISLAFIEKERTKKVESLIMGGVAVLLSLLIFQVPQLAGLWQRTMFFLAFGWLSRVFSRWSSIIKM